jgi:hypothetical protein
MLKCPFCEGMLQARTSEGWQCECGESVPFGFEVDSDENCETCPVLYCPRRRQPSKVELTKVQV